MKLLLFDIDGTLLLTGGAGRVAFERIFMECFHCPDAWKGLIPDGKTDPLIIEELAHLNLNRPLTQNEYDKVCGLYQLYFSEELQRSERFCLMPGIPTLLDQLAVMKDLRFAVATGNFEFAAWAKLEKANLRAYFNVGGFGSDASQREILVRKAFERSCDHFQTAFSAHEVYVIGDSIHDIRAGKAIGAKTIAVATGRATREELSGEKSDYLLDDLSCFESFLTCLEL